MPRKAITAPIHSHACSLTVPEHAATDHAVTFDILKHLQTQIVVNRDDVSVPRPCIFYLVLRVLLD